MRRNHNNSFKSSSCNCIIYVHNLHIYANGLGMVMQACNPSTQEAEADGLRILGQPGLHSKTGLSEFKASL
jgi:hypothetical protein